VKLPFFRQPDSKAADAPVGDARPPANATVVLMVDDEPAQRQLFAFALRREGYWVLEARNGAEALDLAERAGRVDMVVSDVMMPVMKGPEMAARLRERFPGVQVLFVSGFLMGDELGPNVRVMQKPFVRKDLLKNVFEIIGPPPQSEVA
jgi:two-component system cell cycle sensor histidine kinase/response regulator CckA